MIDIDAINVGDCVYSLMSVQSTPVFCEVIKVLTSENAIEVNTAMWGTRVVIAANAYWEEKLAKKEKLVRIQHNYKTWAQEYFNDEETETNNRINPIHNGNTEDCENTREEPRNAGVQKRSKRKQKVVRKSTKRKRKSSGNRKASTSKK